MILIADSGSTKTEWVVIDNGLARESVFTSGINPFFLSGKEILSLLKRDLDSLSLLSFSKIWFYGTGCNSVVKENVVRDAINNFLTTEGLFVGSDLLGAARSLCFTRPGIACIMGTGSNSCYYNGDRIVSNVSPLGYILGDEGGGAVLGRKLISAVLKKQVPHYVTEMFFDTYRITPAEILENVYMRPFPNRFLGQFARFFSSHCDIAEIREILTSSFEEFITRNIMQYPEAREHQVHFTGSIAYHFRSILEELLIKNNLRPGEVTLTPMPGLVKFHLLNQSA